MDLRERIARAICGNWVVGEDRPWMQWAEEADAVIEVLAQKELVAYAIGGEIERIRGELAAEKAWVAEYRDQASKLHIKLEELRQQKPVAWLRAPDKNNRRKLSFERPTGSSPAKALWSPLYLASGVQAVPEDTHREAMRYRALRNNQDEYPAVFTHPGADEYGWFPVDGADLDEVTDELLAKGAT